MNRLCTLLFLVSLCQFYAYSQEYIAGELYYDSTGYVEYIPGNIPVIISVPHGGYLTPGEIPDRDCDGCVYTRDSYTQELGRELFEFLFEQTGCYPHMIINLLHRKKFDANRDIDDAADGDLTVESAWRSYHRFLDTAKHISSTSHERGLLLDLHGHGHEIQRIELGYLLSRSELQLDDEILNHPDYIKESSIRRLAGDNLTGMTLSGLLRGETSLGTLLEDAGIAAVPSEIFPFPQDGEPYFTGGYNTRRHGSVEGGFVDAIQIECHQEIRFDSTTRVTFADSFAHIILEFMETHYDDEFGTNLCSNTSLSEHPQSQLPIDIYPNPATDHFTFRSQQSNYDIRIYSIWGQLVRSEHYTGNSIDIQHLSNGYYLVEVIDSTSRKNVIKLVKQE